VENEFALVPGMGLNIYKHLAYWKQIAFNVDEEVDFAVFSSNPNKYYVGGQYEH
jgi:hypothetical protein